MIVVLSPAKSLDFKTPPTLTAFSQPLHLDQAQLLIDRLRQFSPAELASLMKISDPLAVLNATRYGEWARPFTPENAKSAALAFNGDVYDGLQAPTLREDDWSFAQERLRILSGLYGMLRPFDLIQPYRLEMGTRLANPRGRDLYAFWGDRLTVALDEDLRAISAGRLINLASEEYFKAIVPKKLSVPVLQPVFEDWSGGRYRVVSFFAKRARGRMARFVIDERLDDASGLQAFAADGYRFVAEASDDRVWVFRRRLER
ncbi:MAG TPA: peroxide stress protein YaaA [Accumulibacter sp.]|nr:peroxide stress protein YaaA [Accumulibacter sp.]HMW18816.1 peroxide stress protein YaaA [Accumulibacter sp.]HMX22559.1 peroxide stress protein YaaA [Accumulibacter sp.]HMY05711.1 peroxide stress protein YaaA [Accumulibacter sp.]HNC16932.1 peroxide stress protein YaaA [Accumulibacter sp.]